MAINENTMKFNVDSDKSSKVSNVLSVVYEALGEKGYDPINQIVGYLISGDPTYITSYNSARSIINHVERDEIIEFLLRNYLDAK